jgi:hypothetical protein
MKNIYLVVLLIFSGILATAQTLPNSDFELWDNEASYPSPEAWNTPNNYTLLANVYTVNRSDDAYSGSFSISLETLLIDFLGTQILVPGAITLADFFIDFNNQTLKYYGGYFLQENVKQLTGVYKYHNAGNDSAAILMYNFRHREGEDYDTIGYGYTYLHDAEEWTHFTVNMKYLNGHVPDTFNVLIMSTTDEGVQDPAHAGSLLLVDSLSILTNTGIIDLWKKPVALHVFPNPATTQISFETAKPAKERTLCISDPAGRIILKTEFKDKLFTLPLSGFTPGMYAYSVTEDSRIVNSGTFIKK